MSCWGLRTDAATVAELERTKRAEYERLARDLVAAGLKRPDRQLRSGPRKGEIIEGARDTKAAALRLVAAYNARDKPHPVTDTAKPAADDDACRKSGDAQRAH